MNQMSQEDYHLFQQAESFAKAGNALAAYRLFCLVASHGNNDIEVQFWILQTTHWPTEARNLLAWLEQAVPNHPSLSRARAYVQQKWGKMLVMPPPPATGPVMMCSYCGTQGQTVITSRIAPTGWVIFAVFACVGGIIFLVSILACCLRLVSSWHVSSHCSFRRSIARVAGVARIWRGCDTKGPPNAGGFCDI